MPGRTAWTDTRIHTYNKRRALGLNVRSMIFADNDSSTATGPFFGRSAFKGGFAALFLAAMMTMCPGNAAEVKPASATTTTTQPQQPLSPVIELDGTVSISPDGSELSYEWKQLSGPGVELSDPYAAKPYFRTAKPGVYEFQLVVTANGLSSDPHIVRLEIEHENLPPVAKTPAEVFGQVGSILEIDGRESFDPEGQNLIYRWRPLTPGLNIPLSALSMPVLAFEPPTDGIFELELIVSDGEKASLPALCRVTVKPKPRPPVAQARIITKGVQSDTASQAKPQETAAAKRPVRPIAEVKAIPLPNHSLSGSGHAGSSTPSSLTALGSSGSQSSGAGALSPYATAKTVTGNAWPENESVAVTPAPPEKENTTAAGLSSLPPLPNTDWMPSRLPPPRDTAASPTPTAPIIQVPPLTGNVPPLVAVIPTEQAAYTAPAREIRPAREQKTDRGVLEPLRRVPLPATEPEAAAEQASLGDLQTQNPRATASLYESSPMAPPAPPYQAALPPYTQQIQDTLEQTPPVAQAPAAMMPPAALPQPEKPRYDVMSAPKTMLPFDRPRPAARIKGPKLAETGKPVILDGRASGNGLADSILDYTWRQTKGPDVEIIGMPYGGAGRQIRASEPGVYEFELVVTDGGVQSPPARHAVRFAEEQEPPVAVVVAPSRAFLGTLVTMDATQSYDMGDEKLVYRWRQTGGPSVRNYVIDERLGDSSPAFYPPAPGLYSFELIVSNGKLNSRAIDVDIDVLAKLQAPPEVVISGPRRALVGEKVELTAKASEEDKERGLVLQWRQKTGPEQALIPLSGEKATVFPVEAGRYVFEVKAMEGGVEVGVAEFGLEVEGLGKGGKGPKTERREAVATTSMEERGASRVPVLTPLPNTPEVPAITSFPTPMLPSKGGRGRPAAKVMRNGRPPIADLP